MDDEFVSVNVDQLKEQLFELNTQDVLDHLEAHPAHLKFTHELKQDEPGSLTGIFTIVCDTCKEEITNYTVTLISKDDMN